MAIKELEVLPGQIRIQTYSDVECTVPFRSCVVSNYEQLIEAVGMIATQDFGLWKYFNSEGNEIKTTDEVEKLLPLATGPEDPNR